MKEKKNPDPGYTFRIILLRSYFLVTIFFLGGGEYIISFVNSVLWVRKRFDDDQDPTFYSDANPDPTLKLCISE